MGTHTWWVSFPVLWKYWLVWTQSLGTSPGFPDRFWWKRECTPGWQTSEQVAGRWGSCLRRRGWKTKGMKREEFAVCLIYTRYCCSVCVCLHFWRFKQMTGEKALAVNWSDPVITWKLCVHVWQRGRKPSLASCRAGSYNMQVIVYREAALKGSHGGLAYAQILSHASKTPSNSVHAHWNTRLKMVVALLRLKYHKTPRQPHFKIKLKC